jgi:hypothetical protein
MQKYLKLGGIALLVYFIAYRPDSASQAALRIGGVIGDIANGFGQFISNLFR